MKNKILKIVLAVVLLFTCGISLSSCDSADFVDHNITKDADNFKIVRRVVFYNSITDTIMFEMQGTLNVTADVEDNQLEVIVKLKDDDGEYYYQKHFLGLSDNVTYMVIQVEGVKASDCAFKFYFRPETIPGINIDTLED